MEAQPNLLTPVNPNNPPDPNYVPPAPFDESFAPNPELPPLEREPVARATPDDALNARDAQLAEREAVVTARENRMNEILKNNELEAVKLDDAYIAHQIVSEHFVAGTDAYEGQPNLAPETVRALSCLTLGIFLLRNGSIVTGESQSETPETYDHNKGIEEAREDAKRKIWRLERYVQRNKLMGL